MFFFLDRWNFVCDFCAATLYNPQDKFMEEKRDLEKDEMGAEHACGFSQRESFGKHLAVRFFDEFPSKFPLIFEDI